MTKIALGKNKEECRQQLLTLQNRLNRAYDLVQTLDEGTLTLVDNNRTKDFNQLIDEIAEQLRLESSLADSEDESNMTDVEKFIYCPAIQSTWAHFNTGFKQEQSTRWRHMLSNAETDISYALDQLKHF